MVLITYYHSNNILLYALIIMICHDNLYIIFFITVNGLDFLYLF